MYSLKTSILCGVANKKLKFTRRLLQIQVPLIKILALNSHPENVLKKKSLLEFASKPSRNNKKEGRDLLSRPVTGTGVGRELRETLTALQQHARSNLPAARAGKRGAGSFRAAARLCPVRQVRHSGQAGRDARRLAPPRAPGLTGASPQSGRGLRHCSRPPGPTQRPGSRPKRNGPARPRPGLTQPLRRLQPRPRSPTATPRPVAATAAAIAPPAATAAVAPAPATLTALTSLTPPGAAAKPALEPPSDPESARHCVPAHASRRWRALRRQRECVTLAGSLSSHVVPAETDCIC